MDNRENNENEDLRIFKQLRAIHARFIQCKVLVENAKQHLSAQKNLSVTQCKRATQSFFELDDSTGKLYDLLIQRPLPEIIESQRHSISLTLQSLKQYKNDLPGCINAFSLSNRLDHREETRNKQEDFIVSIQILAEQLDELTSVLGTILASGPSSTSANDHGNKVNNEQEPLYSPIGPSQASDPSVQQVFSTMPPVVLILLGKLLDILIHLFKPKTTRTLSPLDVPKTIPEIPSKNTLPSTNVKIVTTTIGQEEYFHYLYNMLSQHVEPMELERICRKVNINYQSLDDKSHETRAYSLTTKMENQGRLDKLEQELRTLLPERFADENQ